MPWVSEGETHFYNLSFPDYKQSKSIRRGKGKTQVFSNSVVEKQLRLRMINSEVPPPLAMQRAPSRVTSSNCFNLTFIIRMPSSPRDAPPAWTPFSLRRKPASIGSVRVRVLFPPSHVPSALLSGRRASSMEIAARLPFSAPPPLDIYNLSGEGARQGKRGRRQ